MKIDHYYFSRSVKNFHGNESGSIAIYATMILGVLIGAIALAVDYSHLLEMRSKMQNTLDAAVLAAIQEDDSASAEAALNKYVSALPASGGLESFQAEVVSFDDTQITARAGGVVSMSFAPIFGITSMAVQVKAAASRGSKYREMLFALDMSSSMGMAATEEGRKKLGEISYPYTRQAWYGEQLPQGCAFGCHLREGWEEGGKTMYQIARENGIPLLEDELLHQFGGLVDSLLDPADKNVIAGKRKISVMGFSKTTKRLVTSSSSASAVKSALSTFPANQRYETYFANAFQEIGSMLGNQGDGTQTKPEKMLVLITDGIESRDAFYAQSPLDVAYCTKLKDKGFDIAVVELKYPVLLNNYLYNDTIGVKSAGKTVAERIAPALEQCASAGWYFQVTDNSEIPLKFDELKQKFSGEIRLTQ